MERRCGVTFFFAEIRVLREIEFENSWGRLIAPFTVLLFPFSFFFVFFNLENNFVRVIEK